jgi:hypothetical protein
VPLLLVPLALLATAGLLSIASALEQRHVRVLMRMTMRSNLSVEQTESVVASNLAPVLEANGLS